MIELAGAVFVAALLFFAFRQLWGGGSKSDDVDPGSQREYRKVNRVFSTDDAIDEMQRKQR